MGKETVRAIAHDLGVLSADKPASPCLASRIPYGSRVTPQALARIDDAEAALKRLGYSVLRVRHYGPLGRVELAADELPRALTEEGRQPSNRQCRARATGEFDSRRRRFGLAH